MAGANSALELIRSIWPDFSISQKALQEPTTDLVVSFYERFIVAFNEKIAYLHGESPMELPQYNINEFDPIIELFLKVQFIYSTIFKSNIKLMDFYSPSSKRINALFRIGIHFLIFFDNISDEIEGLISYHQKKYLQQKKLGSLKIECRDRINANAKKIGENDGLIEHLSQRSDKMNELKKLLEQEVVLLEQIITEEDYHHLTNLKEQLVNELQVLSKDDTELAETLQIQKQSVESLEPILEKLEKLNREALPPVSNIQSIKEELKHQQSKNMELNNAKKMLCSQKNELLSINEEIDDEHEKKNTIFDETKNELQQKLKSTNAQLKRFQQEKRLNDNECNGLAIKLKNVNDEIEQLKTDIEVLNANFLKNYEDMTRARNNSMKIFEGKLRELAEYSKLNVEK